MIVGHRGAAALAPENTIAGFQKVVDAGINWVEVDVQLSGDQIPILYHDETVNRCSDGKGKLGNFNLEQLLCLDAGSWFTHKIKNEFAQEKIPSLETALNFCLEHNLNMNLELKIHHEHQAKPLVENVVMLLKTMAFPIDKLIVSSFSQLAVKHFKDLYPTVRRGYICKYNPVAYFTELAALELYSLHIEHKIVTEKIAKSVTEADYKLIIWTLNDPLQKAKFLDMGVYAIITDDPNLFV